MYTVSSSNSGLEEDYDIYSEDLVWRVLKINDNGTVDLVAETQTTSSIKLKAPKGYNNGVYLLNDIADKLYSMVKELLLVQILIIQFKMIMKKKILNMIRKVIY